MTDPEPESEAPPPSTAWLIKLLVGGLPLGLAIMGALSFVLYFHQKNQRPVPHPSKLSIMLRQDLSDAEYQRYRRIFAEDLGDRSAKHTENRDAAASFIQSSMGLDNMGYEVVRHEAGPRGKTLGQIEAELPGQSHPRHMILVAARYDNTDVTSIPALMCLAHAFTGEKHANTVRFLALAAGIDGTPLADYRGWIAPTEWERIDLVVLGSESDRTLIKTAFKRDVNTAKDVPMGKSSTLEDVKAAEKLVRSLAE